MKNYMELNVILLHKILRKDIIKKCGQPCRKYCFERIDQNISNAEKHTLLRKHTSRKAISKTICRTKMPKQGEHKQLYPRQLSLRCVYHDSQQFWLTPKTDPK